MLKYSVKLTENDFKNNNIVWREKYVAPDLSFISGVTDFSYNLDKYNYITAESPTSNQGNILKIESEVVTRMGYIIAKNKEYPIKNISGKNYVYINGRYFYENGGKITVKDWQCETFEENGNGGYSSKIVEKDVTVTPSDSKIKLDTIYWIEDGFVTIDGTEYIFDANEVQNNGTNGVLKYTNNGRIIEKPTECDSIVCCNYTNLSDIHEVCKFKAYSTPYMNYKFNNIKCCEYFFFTKYKELYCPVIQKGNNFVCQVPLADELTDLTEYNVSGYTDDWAETFPITTSTKGIKGINDLINVSSFVEINGDDFIINHDYRAVDSSKYIMIQMNDQGITVPIGEQISFVDSSSNSCILDVNNGTVLYDGKKYYAEAKMFDKVKINGTEYDIIYDELNKNSAYVTIDGEQVPMKLNSNNTLTRYGYVLYSGETIAQETYSIVSYSGVNIDGTNYIIKDNSAYINDKSYKIKFTVVDIKGNSLYICIPYLNSNEYKDETYVNNKQFELCDKVIRNQTTYSIQVMNKMFGLQTITKESALSYTDTPTSSDDVFDIFSNLKLNSPSSYINLLINLNTTMGNNLLQGEIIKKNFHEKEKEKAINRIVDMEKDVYSPKIMINRNYSGSNTDFQAIHTININLHFRTRNLDSWKVNDGYNNISVSGVTDNWFITDYEPYKTMITSATSKQLDTIMEMSDVLGFINFDNNDVFYQKSKIAKSFLRLLFYDSTDPQTQSLLATSSVFMNEHNLYKEYIDNSRKGIHKYIQFAENLNDTVLANKIMTTTERLGNKNDKNVIKIERPKDDNPQDKESIYISLNEDGRLSSRFVIDNKYSTDTSSEGFYIYMFREYAEKLHPKPIYMKVEFNHAGIGKIIPFIVPMKWSEKNTDNEVNPISALTLANSGNVETLKEGLPLSWVYAQSYIPLYAVYDFKNKEYGYVFDSRYVKVDENGVANINLFELKVKNDEDIDTNDGTAKIDINQAFRQQ